MIYISDLLEESQMIEILEEYDVGIEIIHFSISDVLDNAQAELKKYEKRLGRFLKERELSLHGPFFDLSPASFDSQIKRVTMERFETAYEIAKQLGAKRIVYHTGFIPITYYIEGWLGNSIAFWKAFMSDKDESIKVHLENVYEEAYWPMAKVIDEVGHKAFTACLDVGHVNAYSSKSIEEWVKGLGSRIGHVHIHNNDGNKDLHHAVHKGTLNMQTTLEHIRQIAPKSTGTLEIADKNQLIDSLNWMKERHNF